MLAVVAAVAALCGVSLQAASVLDVAAQNGCAKLVELVEKAGLKDALNNAKDVTLFAPSDAAIAAVPASVIAELGKNKTALAEVLQYHVVPVAAKAAQLTQDELLPTLVAGAKLRANEYTFEKGLKAVTINGKKVMKADLTAANGVVHVLEGVIYPVATMSVPVLLTFDKDLNNMGYLVWQSGLVNQFMEQNMTVFVPTNEAIKKIPGQEYNNLLMNKTALSGLMNNHLAAGTIFSEAVLDSAEVTMINGETLTVSRGKDGKLTVAGANVVEADVVATNGAIHIIDKVLFPKIPAHKPEGWVDGVY